MQVGTYPLDVIKARTMAVAYDEPRGWLRLASAVYLENGLAGFTRGLLPAAVRAVPACSAMFVVVDSTRLLFRPITPTTD